MNISCDTARYPKTQKSVCTKLHSMYRLLWLWSCNVEKITEKQETPEESKEGNYPAHRQSIIAFSQKFCELFKVEQFPESPNERLSCRSNCGEETPMLNTPKGRILIVDDDPSIRATVSMLLAARGYDVKAAENGFDALLQIKTHMPELIISDLNMPQMSGFEFLSVIRRRFPQVLVVAMSGAFEAGDAVPGGVIADAFYAKGANNPEILLRLVADLLLTA